MDAKGIADLHTACRNGDIAEVRRVIASGAKLNGRDKHSRTPLHMASWAGQVGIPLSSIMVELVLQYL